MNKQKIAEFKNDLRELLKKYNVGIGVDIDGDTHGISENFVICASNGDTLEVINEYESYLFSCDF